MPMVSKVFTPVDLQEMHIKNRVCRAAVNDYSGNFDGTVSKEQCRLYRELAKNQVGLFITGNFYVNKEGQLDATENDISEEICCLSAAELAHIVHQYEAKIVIQISHAGKKNKISKKNALKYSKIQNLSEECFKQIKRDFIKACIHCRKSGADGVQLHFGHGYLLSDILEHYEKGLEFAEELLAGIREKLPKYPVFVKVNSNISEKIYYGFGALCQKYFVTAIEISGSNFAEKTKEDHLYYLDKAIELKKICNVPMILTGGIRTIEDAVKVLGSGIEMVGMGRPFLCEPDLLLKWENQGSKCISCCKCFGLYQDEGYRCALKKGKEVW